MRLLNRSAVSRVRWARTGTWSQISPAGFETIQTSKKVRNRAGADRISICISLGLHIDAIEAERVLINDPVDAAVARPTKQGLVQFGDRAAVPHGNKESDDEALEKSRRACADALEKPISQRRFELSAGTAHDLVRRKCRNGAADHCSGCFILTFTLCLSEFLEFREAAQELDVDPNRGRGEHFASAIGNPEMSTTSQLYESDPAEVTLRPMNAVRKGCLAS